MRAFWVTAASGLIALACAESEDAFGDLGGGGAPPTATGGVGVGGSASGGRATGGFTATGGASGTGGDRGTGGSPSTGGASATGGDQATGGATTGGAAPTGGVGSAGGVTGAGGTPTAGAPSTGGDAPTGGELTTGGEPATGGDTPTGGAATTGGTDSTGGIPAGGAPTGGAPAGGAPTGGAPAGGTGGGGTVECDETTAVDLKGFNSGSGVAVPTDGCAKITEYAPWWTGPREAEIGTTGNGSGYPVPFSWENVCGGVSGSAEFTTDWDGVAVGALDSACTTLIDLQGDPGGTIYLRYL